MPVSGDLRVALGETSDRGVAGVIASIAGLLTGAAGDGGFKGLGGRYSRRNLLRFGVAGVGGLAFTRLDTNVAVDCILRLETVPADPRLGGLLGAILGGTADDAARRLFGELWQDRVRCILIEHADDPEIVELRPLRN